MERQRLLAASVVAARSLRANIRTITGPEGRPRTVLVAGPNQLASVWTRDFCFAVGGLLAAGEERTVRFTLDEIISRQRADGLFPRLLDSYHHAMRYVRAVVTGGLFPLRAPLVANFTSDHFVTAIDSNALVAWAAARYARHTGNYAWAGLVLPRLERGMAFYDTSLKDGFIRQRPFSDWKDTVARRGAVFFTQLLYWKALTELSGLYAAMGRKSAAEDASGRGRVFARRVHRRFWDPERGHFRETPDDTRLSSEGNLAAAAWGFADEDEAAQILRAMDKNGLLTPWGPRAGQRYPASRKAALARFAGIAGYHDDHVWQWNTALLLDVLFLLHRNAMRDTLLESVCGLLAESGAVSEVYNPENGHEVRSWLFRSEKPFSWSAGMLLETFERLASRTPETQEPPKEKAL